MREVPGRRWPKLAGMLIVVLVLFAGLNIGVRWMQERSADNQLFSVLVNNQQLTLDGATLAQFNSDLSRLSIQQRRHADLYIQQWLDRWMDESFALAHQAVPAYLDWYYSMPGSYSRLYYALSGDLDAYLEQRLGSFLLEQSGLEARLAALDAELNAELSRALGEQADVVRQQLLGIYVQRQSTGSTRATESVPPVLDIDTALRVSFSPSDADRQRWQMSSQASAVAGVGAFALVARRALVPRLMALSSVQGARRILAGFSVRLAPRMALAITAGGSAAAVTAPTGPGALVAGGVAFVTAAGTIVVTDFALLKAEEALLRPEKQQQLDEELQVTQIALRETLRDQIELAAEASQAHIRQHLAVEQPRESPRFHILGGAKPGPES